MTTLKPQKSRKLVHHTMSEAVFLSWLVFFLPVQIITGWGGLILGLGLLVILLTLALLFLRKQQKNREQTLQRQLQKEKEQFRRSVLTTLTRDFRTPLTVISAATEQINQQITPPPTEVQLIRANSERLLHLVNRLQDQSQLAAGQLALHLEQSDVISHLRQLVASWRFQARDQHITLEVQSDREQLFMDFDRVRLIYILSNLLNQAFRQTPAGGRIRLQIDVIPADTKSEQVQLCVWHPTADGVPPGSRQAGQNADRAFINELVELMQGDLYHTVQDRNHKHTLTLPITRQAPKKEAISSIPVEEVKLVADASPETVREHDDAPLILIAEDNPDLISLLSQILGYEYNLLIARNGQEGIDLAIRQVPDVVVTDVMMPQKDGYELCYTLKHHELTSHIPIIMMSAKTGTDSRLTGLRQGADVYLEKPFQPEELEALVEAMLAQRQRLQAYYLSISGLSDEVMERPQADLQDQQEDEFLQKVQQLIEDHLQEEDFSVEQLSQLLFMDTSNLYRKVKALTGLSPGQYISSLRLWRAKKLLRETSESILSIALSCGFNSSGYFSRVFKKDTGMTPSAYRKKQQKQG